MPMLPRPDAVPFPILARSGKAKALIVSDLPMRGDSAERSAQQVEAIRLALD